MSRRTLLEDELEARLERMQKDVDKWFEKYTATKLQLKKANYDIGVLKSEVDELQHENAKFRKVCGNIKEIHKEAVLEFQKEKLVQRLKTENKSYKLRNEALSKSLSNAIMRLNGVLPHA